MKHWKPRIALLLGCCLAVTASALFSGCALFNNSGGAAGLENALAPEDRARYQQRLRDADEQADASLLVPEAAPLVASSAVDPGARDFLRDLLARKTPTPSVLAVLTTLSSPAHADKAPLFIEQVIGYLDDQSAAENPSGRDIRQRARDVLTGAEREKAIAVLCSLAMTGPETDTRVRAVVGLGILAALEAAQDGTLIDLLSPDAPARLRARAHRVLQRVTGYDYGPDQEAWRGWQKEHRDIAARAYLRELLDRGDERLAVKDRVIESLIADTLKAADVPGILRYGLDAKLPASSRTLALTELARRLDAAPPAPDEGEGLATRLRPLLRDSSGPLRHAAVRAIARTGPGAAPSIRELLAVETEPSLRLVEIEALGQAPTEDNLKFLSAGLERVGTAEKGGQVAQARALAMALAKVAAGLRRREVAGRLLAAASRIKDEKFLETLFRALHLVFAATGFSGKEYNDVASFMVNTVLAKEAWPGRSVELRVEALKYAGELRLSRAAPRLKAIARDASDPAAGPALAALGKVAPQDQEVTALIEGAYASPHLKSFALDAVHAIIESQPERAEDLVQTVAAHNARDALALLRAINGRLPAEGLDDLKKRLRVLAPRLALRTTEWKTALPEIRAIFSVQGAGAGDLEAVGDACLRDAFATQGDAPLDPEKGPAVYREMRLVRPDVADHLATTFRALALEVKSRDLALFVDVALFTRAASPAGGALAGFGSAEIAGLPPALRERAIERAALRAVSEPALRGVGRDLLKEIMGDDKPPKDAVRAALSHLDSDDQAAAEAAMAVLRIFFPARELSYAWNREPGARKAQSDHVRKALDVPR